MHAIAAQTFEWGTMLHVTRALWFVAQGGKPALAAVKADDRDFTVAHRVLRELGLASLALRSEKLRAEALKAMTTRPREVEGKLGAAYEEVAIAWSKALRGVVSEPAQWSWNSGRRSRSSVFSSSSFFCSRSRPRSSRGWRVR